VYQSAASATELVQILPAAPSVALSQNDLSCFLLGDESPKPPPSTTTEPKTKKNNAEPKKNTVEKQQKTTATQKPQDIAQSYNYTIAKMQYQVSTASKRKLNTRK